MSGQRQLTQLERAEYDKPAADCMAAHCSLVTQLKSGRQCRAYTAQPEQAGANLATSPHTLLRRGGGAAPLAGHLDSTRLSMLKSSPLKWQ